MSADETLDRVAELLGRGPAGGTPVTSQRPVQPERQPPKTFVTPRPIARTNHSRGDQWPGSCKLPPSTSLPLT